MADKVVPGPVSASDSIKEAVCVNTRKVIDACRDKDCIEGLLLYPTPSSAPYIENALSIRPRSAQLLHCEVSVNDVAFNRGYYTVDVTYFYRVRGETFPGNQPVGGLVIFDKRVMLYGCEGRVRTFSSEGLDYNELPGDMPIAVVDAVDPIVLHMSLADAEPDPEPAAAPEAREIPDFIRDQFVDGLTLDGSGRRVTVTLGQFSIIRLERNTQLLIPAYDYCVPEKECVGSTEDDPCTMFSRIRFPMEEFFPPDCMERNEDYSSFL